MSEREQVWRERIEWQRWSGLTVAGKRPGNPLAFRAPGSAAVLAGGQEELRRDG